MAVNKAAHDIIIRPIVSEKSYANSDRGQYTFEVAPSANRVEIKHAVEEIFKVKVVSVNTLHRLGKRVRTRTGWGKRPDQKRAIVKLAKGQQIDVFGTNNN